MRKICFSFFMLLLSCIIFASIVLTGCSKESEVTGDTKVTDTPQVTKDGAGSADYFSVTLLGTGAPLPSPDRFGASTLVEVGGQRLLFDMGRGVAIRLWQKHIAFGTIDAHFITHMHSDHISGVSDLWSSGWIQAPFGGRKTPFTIYCPVGTKQMMEGLWIAFSEDRRIRTEDEHFPLLGLQFNAYDIKPGVVYKKDGVVVTTFEVDHGDYIHPAYGFKVTYKDHSVVISGDTRYNKNVEDAATGADLVIHEVALYPKKLTDTMPAFKVMADHHISPQKAGELFTNAKPKLAVYTHVITAGVPGVAEEPTIEDIVSATRKTYQGPLVVGKDLMTINVGRDGISVIEPD